MAEPAPKPRWYHPSPDRLIPALLVVECLLWLSERFQWTPLSRLNGLTALVAMAQLVVTNILLELLDLLAPVIINLENQP